MKVQGRTVVVTGGGNGIGRELVLGLLARGARAAAIDLSEDGLAETRRLAAPHSDRLTTHRVDITDRKAVADLPAAVLAGHGQVDGVINCAGIIQPFVRVADLELEAVERVMAVNFWGLLHVTRAFLPHLLTRPAAHLVTISSMGGFLPVPGQAVYGASKAAVTLLTEALHSELADTPVRVTTAFPGAIGTEITKNSGVSMPQMASPEEAATSDEPQGRSGMTTTPPAEAARIILDAVEKNAYRVMVGKDARLMDRLARWMPERAAAMIQKRMRSLLD